jgi:hypothetical protein
MDRLGHLKRFYDILSVLSEGCGGARLLSKCSGTLPWPARGVYFFMEQGELRSDSGAGPRVVRVGTHALKPGSRTTLWHRLSQHRGTNRSGGGNHRGSIFRLLVGAAIIKKDGLACTTWDNGSSTTSPEVRANELAMECAVSRTIGAMQFLWFVVDDAPGRNSARGYIERNAIALLSNYGKEPLDRPSEQWLGHCCNRSLVRESGLWNNRHVDEDYDPAFLDHLEAFV